MNPKKAWAGRPGRGTRQRGAALLMAMATSGLLAAVAVELAGSLQNEILLAEAFRDEQRARWAVKAPVALVIAALEEDEDDITSDTERWAKLGEEIKAGDVRVRFRVQDEASKVNPNALASQKAALRDGVRGLLQRMLREKELDPKLADYLRDWVGGSRESPGPEKPPEDFYRQRKRPYAMKQAPLDTLSELRLVRGFSSEALKALGFRLRDGVPDSQSSDLFTIYSDGRINLNTAPPFVLRNLAEGMTDTIVEALITRRADRPLKKVDELNELPGLEPGVVTKIFPMVTVDSQYFSVTSEAVVGRIRKRLTAVLWKRDKESRASVVYWRLS